jgi:hypothetical protein
VVGETQRQHADAKLSELGEDPANSHAVKTQSEKYDRGASMRWVGVAGGALLTSAVPLLRVDVRSGVPWWSYVLGAGGAGLAVWGGLELSKNGSCATYLDDACYERRDTLGRGALLLSAAAPLLSFPIVHLIAWSMTKSMNKNDAKTQAYVVPNRNSLMFVLRKEIRAW